MPRIRIFPINTKTYKITTTKHDGKNNLVTKCIHDRVSKQKKKKNANHCSSPQPSNYRTIRVRKIRDKLLFGHHNPVTIGKPNK